MKKYDDNKIKKIIEIVKNSLSIAEVCRKMNIRPVGGNYKTLKNCFIINNINTSHFTGQGWNVGKRYRYFGKRFKLEDILIEKSTYTNNERLKIRLINAGLKEYKCENCGLIEWKGEKISLHLDHKNGDNLDNRLENLRILCPNCHSQTETYCNSKSSCSSSELKKYRYENRDNLEIKEVKIKFVKPTPIKTINYCECGKEITKRAKRCEVCEKIKQRKVKDRPSVGDLILMVNSTSLEAVGRKYGVSGNAVKKWLKSGLKLAV
jgi:Zn finger protein HypA/HybF involved in hydrogenase expression